MVLLLWNSGTRPDGRVLRSEWKARKLKHNCLRDNSSLKLGSRWEERQGSSRGGLRSLRTFQNFIKRNTET